MKDRSGRGEAPIIRAELRALADPAKAVVLARFFKTGRGEYAEGDRFHGIVVPKVRTVVKAHRDAPLEEVRKLMRSGFHEERLAALLILVDQYQRGDDAQRKVIYDLYLACTAFINNWDLVDLTAPRIVGHYLIGKDTSILTRLARSDSLWERRIAALATFQFICRGDSRDALRIAELLLHDPHDLIHKAVGWMLREVGKRCSMESECRFLDKHACRMPRTMLRYAIERFPEKLRQHYM
ncbi:MAG: DNA alkylation repair protein [Acidobacteria bacterium]|nr:DNA alkylation repair protein [Acidobacteriota bacterium]